MLDGHLFSGGGADQLAGNGLSARLLIYVSCLISAALLALHLAAAAYNQAHARRLLDAIPKPAPVPPQLLASLPTPAAVGPQQQHQQQSSQSNSDASPTYSASDYTFGHKLKLPEAPDSAASSTAPLSLKLPTHLLVQMLALQLLLVLLVESQNCLQRAGFRAATPPYRQWPDEAALPPVGTPTWLLVLALYYLTTALTCWLMGQLIRLNLSLSSSLSAASGARQRPLRSSASTSSSAASDKSAQSRAGQSAVNPSAGSMYTSARSNNVTCLAQSQLAQLNSSTSPTSSFSSINGHSIERQLALSRLEDSAQLYGQLAAEGPRGRRALTRLLEERAPAELLVVHALPLLATLTVAWLSAARSHALNALTYTSSLGAQLAFWPLLVDASATPFSALLYYGPSVSFQLVSLSVLSVAN